MFENLKITNNSEVPLHSKWFIQLSNEESRQQFRKSIFAAKIVLERIKEIIEEEKKDMNIAETSPKDFEDGNWAYKQAFRNGERRGLKVVEDLLQFI